ncbi:MAG TPA: tetratricopeptide repeat protein [Opitutaceae bacterium]|jgi:tetratricopeptide (TPR) repeat protein|nr:tetratricopeptide repeat protein [Opitutaceae bacterium]
MAKAPSWGVALAGVGIVLAALAAYHNSFSVPFLYDDIPTITDNPSIRHLWPIWPVLSPPPDTTATSRPLVNLALAVNYASGGTAVWGYHALNLAIHILAGLALFGVVRRTLLLPSLRGRFGDAALPLALAVAAIWTLHPLQTESVTYVVQRAESMMGLFYLLTLYGCIRGMDSPAPARWHIFAIAACLLGMASKEVMVSAPVMVFLYDRTFVAGSFGEAWRKRWQLYLGLAGTWVLLGYLVVSAGGNRNGAFSFDIGLSWLAYWMTQFQAIARYLWLSIWPQPLIFEYGFYWVKSLGEVLPYMPVVLGLVAGTVIALWRWPFFGFLGAWFLAILAPTSLLPGTSQMIVEHRMYLALAAVVAFVVLGVYALAGRRSVIIFMAAAIVLGFVTWRRNQDFQTELAIWSDTVAKRPDCAFAHDSLGSALIDANRIPEGIGQFWEALRLKPDYPEAHYNLALVLARIGKIPEAIEQYQQSLAARPNHADTHNNLGNALMQAGRLPEAIEQYAQAIRIRPDFAKAHYNLGLALAQAGQPAEAIAQYEEALRLEPGNADVYDDFGVALVREAKMAEAIQRYEQALRINPDHAKAHNNLGNALLWTGQIPQAIGHYEQALRIQPDYIDAQNNLGGALAQAGRLPEAIAHFEEALRLRPDYAGAHYNLGVALADSNRPAEAIRHFEQALQIDPNFTAARESLARLQAAQSATGTGHN